MELIAYFIDIVLHLDKYLAVMVQQYGVWIYAILFAIIFCETGLVVTPFLPGDSLLFVAGGVAAAGGALYALGLALTAGVSGALGLNLTLGVLVGFAMTGVTFVIAIGAAVRNALVALPSASGSSTSQPQASRHEAQHHHHGRPGGCSLCAALDVAADKRPAIGVMTDDGIDGIGAHPDIQHPDLVACGYLTLMTTGQ